MIYFLVKLSDNHCINVSCNNKYLHEPDEEVLAEVGLCPRESLVRGEGAGVHLEDPRPVRRRQGLRVHLGQEDPEFHY